MALLLILFVCQDNNLGTSSANVNASLSISTPDGTVARVGGMMVDLRLWLGNSIV